MRYLCGMKEFVERIGATYNIERADIEELLGYTHEERMPKNHCVVEYGAYNDTLYFVGEGILRAFRSPSDRNLTLWFAYPGDVVVDMFCYYGRGNSPIGIETETEVVAFAITRERLEQVCASSLRMANTVRRIFERHAFTFEQSVLSLWDCEDGRARYMAVLKNHPELLQYVPLKKLASYLMVTPQSLSRIRASLKM